MASDSQLINKAIQDAHIERGGGNVQLEPRVYAISEPIVLKTGVRLIGQGAHATRLVATPTLVGPLVISADAEGLTDANAWLVSEGMPVRFGLHDLMLDGAAAATVEGFQSGCGAYLYGKAFNISGVQIMNTRRTGLTSAGSARGGQESWLDEPEAEIDIRISRCGGDGFVMRGPHDAVIRSAIISRCKGRGLAVETNGVYNGACDIHFCHAYGTDDVAIDLAAKVKAEFLQGDTGRNAGVRIRGSEMTFVARIEAYKTRQEDGYALDIQAVYTQIGMARVRADWGSGGVRINGYGTQINQLDIDGRRNTGGLLAGTKNDRIGLFVDAGETQIGSCNVRHFPAGKGIVTTPKCRGLRITGITKDCGVHLESHGNSRCNIRLDMIRKEGQTYHAAPGPGRVFDIEDI